MVNSVSFAARNVYSKPDLDAPQANSRQAAAMPPQPPVPPKKKHSAAKAILGTVAAVAVAATALALGSKYGAFDPAKVGKVLGGLKDASWLKWAKEPAKKVLGGLNTAGNFVAEYAGKGVDLAKDGYAYVADKAVKGFEAVKNLFSKKTAPTT